MWAFEQADILYSTAKVPLVDIVPKADEVNSLDGASIAPCEKEEEEKWPKNVVRSERNGKAGTSCQCKSSHLDGQRVNLNVNKSHCHP